MWVLILTENNGVYHAGFFVATGGNQSYTKLLQRARIYETQARAEHDRCGNEVAVRVESCLTKRRM